MVNLIEAAGGKSRLVSQARPRLVEVSGKEIKETIAPASLQLRIDPDRIPWVFAALQNQPEAPLFQGEFPEPFTDFTYLVQANQGQLMFVANFTVSDSFKSRYGSTIGSPEALSNLLKRYPQHKFSPDGQQLVLLKDDQIHGIITRANEEQIVILRGGQAGQLTLSKDGTNPINNLSVHLDATNLLIQRYVADIWRSSDETSNKKLQLVLDVPALPEGANETYFSTFGIIGKEFVERPRHLELEDIGGYPDIKAVIKGLFIDLTDPQRSRDHGTQPFSNRLVLVTGREGTGKSLFPKALDAMLRSHFQKDPVEHFRLPLATILGKYGRYSVFIVTTILNHVMENEKNGIPTLLHLDNLEHLVPESRRINAVADREKDESHQAKPTDAEFSYSLGVINPVVQAIANFGKELGGDCHHVIVYGESRLPREDLPEGVTRTFRRSFRLDRPTPADLSQIILVQTKITRSFTKNPEADPFDPAVEEELDKIAIHAVGLSGKDIQQAILDIATRKKADDLNHSLITSEDLCRELDEKRLSKGLANSSIRPIGFTTPANS